MVYSRVKRKISKMSSIHIHCIIIILVFHSLIYFTYQSSSALKIFELHELNTKKSDQEKYIRHLQICPRKIKLGNSIYKIKCQPKNPTVQVSKSIYTHTVKPLPTLLPMAVTICTISVYKNTHQSLG